MSDEELKKKAEEMTLKTVFYAEKVMTEAVEGMTEDEKSRFMVYWLAALGTVLNTTEHMDCDEDFDAHEAIDAMHGAYEMIYINDQKPEDLDS